jgi:DNA modification methylase
MAYMGKDQECAWVAAHKLFPGNVAYVWHAAMKGSEVAAALGVAGFEVRAQIIWAKDTFAISRGHYNFQHEPCWYAVRKGKSSGWLGGQGNTSLWKINRRDDQPRTGHATQKPVEVMRKPIPNHTQNGDTVYDPFLGSGTTLIACETINRACLGLELDPRFVDVIVTRWQNLTGKQATLEGHGATFEHVRDGRRLEAADAIGEEVLERLNA